MLMTCPAAKGTNCKSTTDIMTYMAETQLSLFYTNFYFDSNDFVKPIKSYIDDKYWFAIIPTIRKDADIFVRYNTLSLQDGYIQISGDTNKEFMGVSGAIQRIDEYSASDGRFVRVYFRVDPIVTGYNRQIYSSGDLLAQVGGIYSFLYSIGAVLVYVFSERLFVAALAEKLYQVYDEKNGNKYDESDNGGETSGPNTSSNSLKNKTSNKIHNVSAEVDEENKFFKSNPIRNLIRNTLYCKSKSEDISKKLKEDKELDDIDIMKIKSLVTHRKRLEYNTLHVLEYYLCCVYWRQRYNRKKWKRHILFKNADDKLNNQLDVVNILRWIEHIKILSKGFLNHKQKFWLKFQKEHIIDVEYNSEVERQNRIKEEKQEEYDLIKGIQQNDQKSIKKVREMLQYLKHGNRSNFDLKIIQGLFEEYCSDSNEEENIGKVMNTEEEYNEFYSLARPENQNTGNRPRKSMAGNIDISNMNIFNKEDGIISIGRATLSKLSSTPYLDKSYTAKKTTNFKKATDTLSDLNSKKIKTSKTKFKRNEWGETRSISKISHNVSEKKKLDFKEADDEESDENNITKAKINKDYTASVMDYEQDDFIQNLENEITNRNTKDNSFLDDTNGKKSSKDDILKNSSNSSKKKDTDSEEEKKQQHLLLSNQPKFDEWNEPKQISTNKQEKVIADTQKNQYKDGSTEQQDVKFV